VRVVSGFAIPSAVALAASFAALSLVTWLGRDRAEELPEAVRQIVES